MLFVVNTVKLHLTVGANIELMSKIRDNIQEDNNYMTSCRT